jgi:hypothetical protein
VGDSRTPMSAGLTEPVDGQQMSPAGGGDEADTPHQGEAIGDSDVLLPPLVTPAGTPVRMHALPPKTGDAETPASGGWAPQRSGDGASPLWSPSASQTLYIAAAAAAGAAVVATAYYALSAASHRPGRTRWRSREGDVAVAGSMVLWRTVERRT